MNEEAEIIPTRDLPIEPQAMVTCEVCGQPALNKGNRLGIHYAKLTDLKPCPKSWPEQKKK